MEIIAARTRSSQRAAQLRVAAEVIEHVVEGEANVFGQPVVEADLEIDLVAASRGSLGWATSRSGREARARSAWRAARLARREVGDDRPHAVRDLPWAREDAVVAEEEPPSCDVEPRAERRRRPAARQIDLVEVRHLVDDAVGRKREVKADRPRRPTSTGCGAGRAAPGSTDRRRGERCPEEAVSTWVVISDARRRNRATYQNEPPRVTSRKRFVSASTKGATQARAMVSAAVGVRTPRPAAVEDADAVRPRGQRPRPDADLLVERNAEGAHRHRALHEVESTCRRCGSPVKGASWSRTGAAAPGGSTAIQPSLRPCARRRAGRWSTRRRSGSRRASGKVPLSSVRP